MKYQLSLVKNNNCQDIYNVKYNGNIMKNDIGKTFEINVNHTNKNIMFKSSTISAKDVYAVLGLIRKEISKSYSIKCI